MTAAARRAAALDTLERALSTGAFAYAVLVADSADGLEALPPGVRLDVDPGSPRQDGQGSRCSAANRSAGSFPVQLPDRRGSARYGDI